MKILEKEFRKKGFFHEQVWREGDLAIYKRWRVTEDAQSEHFEVICILNHEDYKLNGVLIPASEVYASASNWGTYGWTYKTLEEARAKVKKLQEKV